MTVTIDASGLTYFEELLEAFPAQASLSMSNALNEGAAVGLKAARKEIASQVNFPPGYLDMPGRVEISQYSNPSRLEAKISGRGRGTSLAQFVQGGAVKGRGLTIMEKPGQTKYFPTAFLATLKRGTADSGNIGFAIRVKPGDVVHGVQRYSPVVLYRNKAGLPTAYLLYGASVDQVFNDVADKITPEVTSAIRNEFLRLMDVRLKVTNA